MLRKSSNKIIQKIFNSYYQKGFSIIEILIAIAISFIASLLFLKLVGMNQLFKSEVDQSQFLKELLLYNTIELKSTEVKDLPAPGKCLYRSYNQKGDFISETTFTSTEDDCGQGQPGPLEIQVFWLIEGTSSIAATFSSPSLKFPKYTDSLKKVTLTAKSLQKGSTKLLWNQVVIFKR